MSEEIVRVLRVLEYIGPRSWVEDTVARSIHGTKLIGQGRQINGATLGFFPEILQKAVVEPVEEGWTGRDCVPCKGTGQTDDAGRCNKCAGTGDEYGPLVPAL